MKQTHQTTQPLRRPNAAGADDSFRKLQQAVQAARADRDWHARRATRLTYALATIAFCFGTAAALYGIHLIVNGG